VKAAGEQDERACRCGSELPGAGAATPVDAVIKTKGAAVRADKTCLAGLTATLLHYLKDEAERQIPIWKMMACPLDQLKARAEAWRDQLGQGEVLSSESTVGGGSLPEECVATFVLALTVKSPDKFLKKLRDANPPVVARTENDKALFDPRTVLNDDLLLSVLKKVLGA